MPFKDDYVTYEAFGATGNGVTDDLPAICAAHAHANAHGLSVVTRPDATYHLGRRSDPFDERIADAHGPVWNHAHRLPERHHGSVLDPSRCHRTPSA